MKFGGQLGGLIWTNCFDFGEDPDPDTGVFNGNTAVGVLIMFLYFFFSVCVI